MNILWRRFQPIWTSRPWRVAGVLFAVSLCLYLPFRSISLDDFDAYSFALALDEFSLALQQPQPPGFPVYVFMGRCLRVLTGNARAALTCLSAWSGAIAVVLLYALGRLLPPSSAPPGISHKTGVIAALAMALLPMMWLTAEKALSDVPGLMWTLLALYLLCRARDRSVHWALAGGVTALALGVRPQNALPLALFVAYVGLQTLLGQRPLQHFGALAGGGLLGVCIWLLPTARAVGGIPAYVDYVLAHAAHVGQADALSSLNLPLLDALRARAMLFGDTLLTYTVGVGLFSPWTLTDWARVALSLGVLLPALLKLDWRSPKVWGLTLWASVMAAQIFLFETLDRPRLMLPLLPPIALLLGWGWARARGPTWLRLGGLSATMLLLLIQGVPLLAKLSTVPAPPAQATAYVAAKFPSENTLIATAGSFRAVQVELPAYRYVYLYEFDPHIVTHARKDGLRYIVIFDRDQFPADAVEVLSDAGRWVSLEERTFSRDRRVHTQHDQVRVQVLTPADQVPAAALALPPDGCIDLGTDMDGRYLGQGWFRPEDMGGVRGRWAGETITSTLRVTLDNPDARYHLRIRAMAYPTGQTLKVRLGTQTTEAVALPQGWTDVELTLPAGSYPADVPVLLNLIHARASSPFEVTGGGSSDTRPLTAAYDRLCFVPLP